MIGGLLTSCSMERTNVKQQELKKSDGFTQSNLRSSPSRLSERVQRDEHQQEDVDNSDQERGQVEHADTDASTPDCVPTFEDPLRIVAKDSPEAVKNLRSILNLQSTSKSSRVGQSVDKVGSQVSVQGNTPTACKLEHLDEPSSRSKIREIEIATDAAKSDHIGEECPLAGAQNHAKPEGTLESLVAPRRPGAHPSPSIQRNVTETVTVRQ